VIYSPPLKIRTLPESTKPLPAIVRDSRKSLLTRAKQCCWYRKILRGECCVITQHSVRSRLRTRFQVNMPQRTILAFLTPVLYANPLGHLARS